MSNVPSESSGPKRVQYPFGSLPKGLEIGEVIKNLGGNREPVTKALVARQQRVGENSGPLQSQLGVAKAYGIIEGAGAFRLTDIGKKYFYPVDPTDKQQAHLKMLVVPVVFEKLVERYDGDELPAPANLANLLIDMAVPESWTQRVVSFFINAAKHVGVLGDDGFLRYGAAQQDSRQNSIAPLVDELPAAPATPAARGIVSLTGTTTTINHVQGTVNVWVFGSRDSAVKIETSKELSMGVWEKLNQYVQILKPSEEPADGP